MMMSPTVEVAIQFLAENYAKQIRRADNIDYDPEGQRLKAILAAAMWDAYRIGVPEVDDANTVTVHVGNHDSEQRAVHEADQTGAQPNYRNASG